jgi:hypothetical protein
LIQRCIDAASEAVDVVGHRLSAVADPRGRMLRKRKWALRLGLFFGAASVFWMLVTALLASWSTPVWALIITGVVAAGAAFPAVILLMRYRWLRAQPLPPRRTVATHRLPPPGSAARPAMYALGASERGLVSLISVIERGELLPAAEIAELSAAADRSASAMTATAAQVVSMERAAGVAPQAREQLVPTINAFTAQLGNGVRQYNEMVTAAAQLVSSATGNGSLEASPIAQQRYRNELTGATDRLLGWAQAFDELGELRRA